MADDVLLSNSEVSESAEDRKKADRERKRRERQASTEAKGKVFRPKMGNRIKDPAPLDVDAPLVKLDSLALQDGLEAGQVGKAQDRLNNESKPARAGGMWWWLLRGR